MHKSLDFLKKETNKDNRKNIIFLDIDGVLQPYSSQKRFDHDLTKTIVCLCDKYNDNIYEELNKYDVGAVFYDWDEIAIGILKKLLLVTNSYIVIHSNWRESKNLNKMKALFKLHNLDEYIIDCCDNDGSGEKIIFIKKYLEEHKDEIKNYIIIDDEDMTLDFGGHFYKTNNMLTMNDYYNIYWFFNYIEVYSLKERKENENISILEFYKKEKLIIEIYCKEIEIENNKKMIFCKYDKINMENYENISLNCFYIRNFLLNYFYQKQKDYFALIIIDYDNKYFDNIKKATNIKEQISENNWIYYFPLTKKSSLNYNFYKENKNLIINFIK